MKALVFGTSTQPYTPPPDAPHREPDPARRTAADIGVDTSRLPDVPRTGMGWPVEPEGLTEALVVELEPYGIGVSLVNPGPVATHFGEARGHPYDRKRPKAVPAEQVADAVIKAVDGDKHEQYVPSSFRGAVVARHSLPPLFRWGSRRSFTKELAEDRRAR